MKCVRTLLPFILVALLLAGCAEGKTAPEAGINAAPESGGDGNYLLYEISRKTPEGYYEQVLRTLDLTTGQFSRAMTLKDGLGNTIVPQGEHGDFFLVINDYRSVWADGTGDGVDDTELFLPVYAFIAKEDYYNSQPNYRSFSAES